MGYLSRYAHVDIHNSLYYWGICKLLHVWFIIEHFYLRSSSLDVSSVEVMWILFPFLSARALSAAVDALASFIRCFITPGNGNSGVLLQPVLLYLSRYIILFPLLFITFGTMSGFNCLYTSSHKLFSCSHFWCFLLWAFISFWCGLLDVPPLIFAVD